MAVASTTGCALSANMKTFMPAIPISLMTRTSTIALASGVRGLTPAARKAVRDDKSALKDDPWRGSLVQDYPDDGLAKCCTFPSGLAIGIDADAGSGRSASAVVPPEQGMNGRVLPKIILIPAAGVLGIPIPDLLLMSGVVGMGDGEYAGRCNSRAPGTRKYR